MKMILKSKDALAMMIISVLYLVSYIVELANSNEASMTIMILAVAEAVMYCAYIVMLKKPVLSILMILGSNLISCVYALVIGLSIRQTFEQYFNIIGLLIILAFLIQFYIADKNNDKKTGIKERIITDINYNRKPFKLPLYANIIIYSCIVILLCEFAKSSVIAEEITNGSQLFKLYASTAVVYPTILLIGMLTTSRLAYQLLNIKFILDSFTLFIISDLNSGLDISKMLVILPTLTIIVYSVMKFSEDKKSKELNS